MGIIQINDNNGITTPIDVWEQIGVKPGDKVMLRVEGRRLIITAHDQPQGAERELPSKSYSDQLRGLHADIWEGVDPDEYIRREREAWEEE